MGLKNSQTFGGKILKIKFIRYAVNVLVPPLVNIYKKVIENGQFPSYMKQAKLSVLHNVGHKNDMSNTVLFTYCLLSQKGVETNCEIDLIPSKPFCNKLPTDKFVKWEINGVGAFPAKGDKRKKHRK